MPRTYPSNPPDTAHLRLPPEWGGDLDLLRTLIWPQCSAAELALGIAICRALRMNPFLRHVVYIQNTQGRGAFYTTRDGLLHLAHASGQLDGMQSGVTHREPATPGSKPEIAGAWCKVYRKDMAHPFEVSVSFEEYYRPNAPVWRQYPAAMIKKVAEHMALKLAFNVSGLASVDEVDVDARSESSVEGAPPTPAPAAERTGAPPSQQALRRLVESVRGVQRTYGLSQRAMQRITGRETLRGLTAAEVEAVQARLDAFRAERGAPAHGPTSPDRPQ